MLRLALALVATLSLAACSGGDDASVEPASASGSTERRRDDVRGGDHPRRRRAGAGGAGTVAWQVDAATTGIVDLTVEQVRREPARARGLGAAGRGRRHDAVLRTATSPTRARPTSAARLPLYLRDTGGMLARRRRSAATSRLPVDTAAHPFGPGATAEVCLSTRCGPEVEPDAMTFQPTSTEAWRRRLASAGTVGRACTVMGARLLDLRIRPPPTMDP